VWGRVSLCGPPHKKHKNITTHTKPLSLKRLRFYVCFMFYVMFKWGENIKLWEAVPTESCPVGGRAGIFSLFPSLSQLFLSYPR
jgi:hypothetical protein